VKAQPLQDRILIRRLEEAQDPKNLIFIPENAKEKPQRGEVLAIGPGRMLEDGSVIKLSLVVGDKVLFGKYTGSEIKIDGEELLVMREDDVLVRFKE